MATLEPNVIAAGWATRWPREALLIIKKRPFLWLGLAAVPYLLAVLLPASSLVPLVFGWLWLAVCFELASLKAGPTSASDVFSVCKEGVWQGLRDLWEARAGIAFFILLVAGIILLAGKAAVPSDSAVLDEQTRTVFHPLYAWLFTKQSPVYAHYGLLPAAILLIHRFLPFVYHGIRTKLVEATPAANVLAHKAKSKNWPPCVSLEALVLGVSFSCGFFFPALLPIAMVFATVIGWVAFDEIFPGNGRELRVSAPSSVSLAQPVG